MPPVAAIPPVAPGVAAMPPYVVVAPPRRSAGKVVLVVLLCLIVIAGLVAAGAWAYFRFLAAPADQDAVETPSTLGSVASVLGEPMAKVSLRANAEGWSQEESTPIVVYIKKSDGGSVDSASSASGQSSSSASGAASSSSGSSSSLVSQPTSERAAAAPASYDGRSASAPTHQAASSSGSAASSSSGSASSSSASNAASGTSASSAASSAQPGYEAYHAFMANENETLNLSPGRYTFTYISPLNSDRSLYQVPEMVEVTVGKDGTALLPVTLTRVAPENVTDEMASEAIAKVRTAMEKGDESFSNAAFKTAFDKALGEWFAEKAEEEREADLTDEEKAELDAQADAANGSGSSDADHTHTWVEVTTRRWVPNPVIVAPGYDEPVYDEDGERTGTVSHAPTVEDQGRYDTQVTGHRCSGCGATVQS